MSKGDTAAGGIEQMLASLCDELTSMYRGEETNPRDSALPVRTFNKYLDLCDGTRMRLEAAIYHHLPILILPSGSSRILKDEREILIKKHATQLTRPFYSPSLTVN